jgi:hypothetical protein
MEEDMGASLRDRAGHEPSPKGLGHSVTIPCAWRRYRFRSWAADDPRPVTFPPPGPYWVTGLGERLDGKEFAILVAYLPGNSTDEIEDFWPETDGIEWSGYDFQWRDEIAFTTRFQRPDWWPSDSGSHPEGENGVAG